MIVTCSKCHGRFRVADEKIGPRGAKVRCSKCQTVFVVHRAPEPVSARRGDAAAGAPAAPPPPAPAFRPILDDPFTAVPAPAAFAPAALARAADDPFAQEPARGDDPFAPAAASRDDPFALPAPRPAAEAARATLPVTDLADLLGSSAGAAAAEPVRTSPPPLPVPPPLPPVSSEGPFTLGPPDLARAIEDDDGGLALEDRLTPPPKRVAPSPLTPEPALDFTFGSIGHAHGTPAAFAEPLAGAAMFDPATFEPGGGAAAAVASTHEPAEPLAAAPVPAPMATEPRAAAAAPAPHAAAPVPQERAAVQRGSRLRVLAVNAVSLLVMIAIAIALLLVWRSDRPLEAGSFRPAALLGALRRDPSGAGPFVARDVRSGVYERARAAPLLFVRGQVVSRAPAPVAAVTVKVEVVRGEQVLARGESLAGAVPTPEELHEASDAAGLARAARVAATRAPRAVRPGDAVPFLVAIGEAPADLEGASVRVALSPVARAAR